MTDCDRRALLLGGTALAVTGLLPLGVVTAAPMRPPAGALRHAFFDDVRRHGVSPFPSARPNLLF
jgi:hypothetical protein